MDGTGCWDCWCGCGGDGDPTQNVLVGLVAAATRQWSLVSGHALCNSLEETDHAASSVNSGLWLAHSNFEIDPLFSSRIETSSPSAMAL